MGVIKNGIDNILKSKYKKLLNVCPRRKYMYFLNRSFIRAKILYTKRVKNIFVYNIFRGVNKNRIG